MGDGFIRHIPCGACGSSDANSEYADGHTHCFACGAHTAGDGSVTSSKRRVVEGLIDGEILALEKRKLTEETCQKFGYKVGTYKKKPVQIAPYYNADGELVAQKIRFADKSFTVVGDIKDALPFGANQWRQGGKKLVVTEGEIDALSMSQVQGNKWPVVSIGCGAGPQIKKYFSKHKDYFSGFDEVILVFDMDEPGRKAAQDAAEILGTRAKIASLPGGFKDPNEMLQAGKVSDMIGLIFSAQPYRPEGIVELADLKDKAKEKPRMGLSWPWPALTELTYGIQRPYIYTIGAGTGTGKTDVLRQVMTHLVTVEKVSVAGFILEEEPHVTAVGLASKVSKTKLHTPEGWNEETFDSAWATLMSSAKVHLYDSFGMNDWDVVRSKIEYLHHVEGVNYFFLDHLTAFAAGAEDERKVLEDLMAEMSGLVTRLGICIVLVSHLATPDGKSHEEGGRVILRHFKGARAIGFWSFGAIGLERDQQADDPVERHTTTVRILKLRGFGWQVGKTMQLRFKQDTGMLEETNTEALAIAGAFESSGASDAPRSDF